MEAPSRPPYYLLTGLILGVVLGLLYGWLLTPVDRLEATPEDLRANFKDTYRELVARAYLANNDLGRAESRLALLGDPDPARALSVQAQLTLGEGGSEAGARALGYLAAAMENEPASTPLAGAATNTLTVPLDGTTLPTNDESRTSEPQPSRTSPPGGTPTSSNIPVSTNLTPTVAATNTPTPTPTATQGPPFILVDVPLVCNSNIDPPLIQVYVFDASGNQVPGVAVLVTWEGNTNRFITGLKPEFGLGYADFTMDPSKTYTLRLEDGGDPVTDITGRQCEDQSEPYWGTWRLNFVQP
ncbi:MAG TPA: hypothetical protein VJ965_07465 [Anaerolineales bacterium]|nr:hypothetical protein [Anaerolineales bacterium]